MVLRHGHVVAEGWWSPYAPDRVHLLYSLSKSFTSTAAGFAVAEGLLDLDAPVHLLLPGVRRRDHRSAAAGRCGSGTSRRWRAGTWHETLDRAVGRDPLEPVRGFLLIPPDAEPGTVFAYNQPCTYTLAAIIQRLSGQSLTDYLRPRLFEPLGIEEYGWQQHPPGPRHRLLRPPRHHRRHRQAGPALPAAWGRGTAGSCSASDGWLRRPVATSTTRTSRTGLASGLRIPVLDGAARLPRRRSVRPVLRDPARTRHRDRHDRGHPEHAGHPGRPLDARAAGDRRVSPAERGR